MIHYCSFFALGTELTKANLHTADGISVRFPRVTRIRDDKDWETATNLEELKHLYKTSKEKTDVSLLNKLAATASESYEPPKKKMKESPKPKALNKIDSFLKKEKSPNEKKIKQELNNSNLSDTKSETDNTIANRKVTNKDEKYESLPENPLPDVFIDKRLGFYPDFVSFPETERRHFERHWIAYGGIVVKSLKSTDVDFLVHNEDVIRLKHMQKLNRKMADTVRHVNKNWLIKCINEIKLCDPIKYPVYIIP